MKRPIPHTPIRKVPTLQPLIIRARLVDLAQRKRAIVFAQFIVVVPIKYVSHLRARERKEEEKNR